jgi:hypothetical protein
VRRWLTLRGRSPAASLPVDVDVAAVRFANGMSFRAELHWYEAHGIGRRKMKVKRLLEQLP